MAAGSYSRIAASSSILFLLLGIVLANNYHYDFQGPFCAQRLRSGKDSCCDGRQDDCSVPISTTFCYCDIFCDRSNNGDCCPDYESVCLGKEPEPEPIVSCVKNRIHFQQFETIKDNCNECKCHAGGRTVCEQDVCLVDPDAIQQINVDSGLGWRAQNYSEFWGRKYREGLELRLGTFEPIKRVRAMSRMSNRIEQIPDTFNSLEQWPSLITGIRDQGWCASSWAVSTATVASDRFSIKSKGRELVDLAPQHLLSCVRRQQGCHGGHLDTAWNYFKAVGIVDEDCMPYSAQQGICKIKRRGDDLQTAGCRLPTKVDRKDFYKMGPAYSLRNETDIKYEILHYGPVQATMRVYHDFFSYSGGVYRRSRYGENSLSGFHSVRLVGWGEERDGYQTTKYWIAANTWGTWWGEQGYFRILRGNNECGIEDYVLSSLASLHVKKNGRKRIR